MENEHYYRGNLPHWQPPEGTFFITYRLYGSIPRNVIQELKAQYESAVENIESVYGLPVGEALEKLPIAERQHLLTILEKKKYDEQKRSFARFDGFLDHNLNEPHWLKIPDIAELVASSIQHFANKHYQLWAYTIMSNHVHILLTMLPGAPMLWKVLQDSKKYSGRQANQWLGREGEKFWEHESYDHLVRDGKLNEPGEFYRIQNYILNNPVKAGLVKTWEEWPWTYYCPALCPAL
ncbi:MAG: transposase [Saprospiraceae bacterium]